MLKEKAEKYKNSNENFAAFCNTRKKINYKFYSILLIY